MPVYPPPSGGGAASSGIVVQEADGSPSGTATTLVVTNGQLTSVSGGTASLSIPSGSQPISGGTAFPGSPADNDLFFRTDLDLVCFYDGTRWMTTTLYALPLILSDDSIQPYSISSANYKLRASVWKEYDTYLVKWYLSYYVNTTNDGTSYWNFALLDDDGTNLGSLTSAAESANTWTQETVTVNALLGTTHESLGVTASKTSTPGTLYMHSHVSYRLVIT